MKALLTNYHQSPQKVRLVANLIRGKSVPVARAALAYLPKKSSPMMLKLLNSAVANARTSGVSENDLFVKMVAVNKGGVMRRFKPMARGRAARYAKTMSIISLELGTTSGIVRAPKAKAAPKVEETAEASEKKTAAKPRAAKKTAKKTAKTK